MGLADELKKIVKGEVLDSPAALDAASRDASLFRVVPKVVVRPKDVEDVKALVKFVSSKKRSQTSLSLTVRSGGTDMGGGPLNDSIIVDMVHFNHVIEVGEDYAITEPGVYFRDFDKETKKKGLELPSYTASREICTVGGMVANDSGGEKNLKYGKTARYVEELEMVMADGEVHTLREVKGENLKVKMQEPGFEGDAYRSITNVLQNNSITIEEATPVVSKNSSGYALWDIGDGTTRLNLARLMTGAQGTLGIITKIKFRLVKPKAYSSMLVIFLKDLGDLAAMVPEVMKDDPDSFESYDDHTFSLAIKYFPELAIQMKAGIVAMGWSLLPEMLIVATGGIPKLVLLVEFRADSQAEALGKAEKLRARLDPLSQTESMRVAKDERVARKYWAIRRESFNLLRKKVRGKRTAPFIDDFVVPPECLAEFLPKLRAILDGYDFTYTVAGHVGDGNFHIIPLVDPKRTDLREIIDRLSHQVYDLVLSYHGSISGEHNDGIVRTPYVEKMFGPAMQSLFDEVNRIMDPLDIFNPGKKVRGTVADALAHLDLPVHKGAGGYEGGILGAMPPEQQTSVPVVAPPAPPVAPAPVHQHHIRAIAFAVAALIVIAGAMYFFVGYRVAISPETRFSLFEGGSLSWYVLKPGGSLVDAPGPGAFADSPFTVTATGMTLASGDTPVIAAAADGSPGILGIVRRDGTLVPLLADGVPKYTLAVRHDGELAYVAYSDAIAKNGVAVGDWQIMRASAYDVSPAPTTSLGKGFSIAFANDGGLIAIAPEGLVRIDSATGNRETLIDRPGVTFGVAALAPGATAVAIPNAVTHALDIFSLDPANPRSISYLSSVTGDADAASFIDDHTIIIKAGNSFSLYSIEGGALVGKPAPAYTP